MKEIPRSTIVLVTTTVTTAEEAASQAIKKETAVD